MTQKCMSKLTALGLAAALLLSLCGCGEEKQPPVDTDTTTVSTTDNTTAETTENTTAPTTEATTKPTSKPTTPAKPALQFGGKTFTLDGHTFTMGESPKALLDFLGKPNDMHEGEDWIYGSVMRTYRYDHVMIETFAVPGHVEEFLSRVYFFDNAYSFDGVTAGDTVEKLDELVSTKLKPKRTYNGAGYEYGGVIYQYQSTENEHMFWRACFDEHDLNESLETMQKNGFHVPAGSKITCILLVYEFEPIVSPYFENT